ncbi:MAG: 30S ribosomal protein S6 [Verrucomicrobia bacterium]|nr:30S ribosomal protein S6 [Verrucomicrobiota bacterium]MBI3868744.1 30S ribosomal protein S6 [Verrucomicrobiota bacterium]
MKKYEGLFILNTAGKEEGVKEAIDKISAEITEAGAKVETVQKMDKRNFTRIASKKHTSGFYVNMIFECQPAVVAQLQTKFALNPEVFRVLFSILPPQPPARTIPQPVA